MRLVALAAALGLAAAPLAPPAFADDGDGRIIVTGSAEAVAVPDVATISVGVETRAATAGEALDANSAAMTGVLAAVEGAGVERRDVQTSQLAINPVYEPYNDSGQESQKVAAYVATNTVTVRLRDIDKLGAMVDAVTKAGGNRIDGIGFEVSDPKAALDGAREKAVADARAKAELFARAAGVSLGPVLRISEATAMPGPIMMRMVADAAAAPPVERGTVSLQAQVEVVYGLKP